MKSLENSPLFRNPGETNRLIACTLPKSTTIPRTLLCSCALQKGGVACELAFIIGFIDGTIRAMCRPRGEDDLQRECYDGHHKVHGLAWQFVVFADGIIGDPSHEDGSTPRCLPSVRKQPERTACRGATGECCPVQGLRGCRVPDHEPHRPRLQRR